MTRTKRDEQVYPEDTMPITEFSIYWNPIFVRFSVTFGTKASYVSSRLWGTNVTKIEGTSRQTVVVFDSRAVCLGPFANILFLINRITQVQPVTAVSVLFERIISILNRQKSLLQLPARKMDIKGMFNDFIQ